MSIERAFAQLVRKPWGSPDLRPWSDVEHDGVPIGEVWFERSDKTAKDPALLLKLLFTKQPLSIQVHPGDAFAQSIGLANGKTEAWYVLSAVSGAEVAIGLKHALSPAELRSAIVDGSIADKVQWREVSEGDVCFVPAGTIHAIGAGIVLAEIQQRSNATFRIFDYDRERELHIENAMAVADLDSIQQQAMPTKLSDGRISLVANRHFVLEKISLPAGSRWLLQAKRETWMLVLEGAVHVGMLAFVKGEAVFLDAEQSEIQVGSAGLEVLVAYPGPIPDPALLIASSDKVVAAGDLAQLTKGQNLSVASHARPEVQT